MNRQRGMGVNNGTISNPQRMDVGIIIALREEFTEFHQQIRDCCTPIQDRSTGRAYYQFIRNSNNSDQTCNCVATFVGEMGETQCALHTEELISKWQPETVVMLGIAGGISKDVRLGDIVVATQVDNYLARSKAVTTTDGAGFEFERGGEAYRPSDDLINFARNLQFVQESCFQQWVENCANERQDLISKEKCEELAGLNLLREQVSWFDGHIASGPTVGAARAFSEWLKGGDRNYLALEMEAAGLMAAVYRKADPARTLLLRGISDYADERKDELDKFKDGAFRRYAMRNAIHFLWSLLNAGVLPVASEAETASQEVSVTPARSDKPLDPQKISLAKLPSTEPDLFGREKELEMLDEAWDDPETKVISLLAFGGMGKSALVNVWLNGMEKDHYRNAERVYGWSFYSQGASEGAQASADEFIAAALGWFGDLDPTAGSPWDKGERLAELVRKQRTLLILDGMEPLQNPPGGEIKAPSLKSLLRELARQNPGLCVITTRLKVDDLKDCVGTSVQRMDLEKLSPEAGMQLLRNLGADGIDDELKKAVREFGGHALALTLLGRYLAVVYEGNIRQRDKIAKLTKEPKQGGHARRVMESYERWFDGKPELDILRIMGLFDRPAEGGAIEAVRAEPVIDGLTSELKLSHADWQFALSSLREARLLSPKDPKILFSMGLELREDLENGNFSERLRQQFTNNNIPLPQNIITIHVKAGQEMWTIHDGSGSTLYVIKKEDDSLNTYDPNKPDSLDCHPLIREHFGEKLKECNPKVWKEAHRRLYGYFKSQADCTNLSIDEWRSLLFQEFHHTCEAGCYNRAYNILYSREIDELIIRKTLHNLGHFALLLSMAGELIAAFENGAWTAGLGRKFELFILSGSAHRKQGNTKDAKKAYRSAICLVKSKENMLKKHVDGLLHLADVYYHMGDFSEEMKTLDEAARLGGDLSKEEQQEVDIKAVVVGRTGRIFMAWGFPLIAAKFNSLAIAYSKEAENLPHVCSQSIERGDAYLSADDLDRALKDYEKARDMACSHEGRRDWEGEALRGLGDCYRIRGNHAKSLKYYGESLEIAKRIAYRWLEAKVCVGMARVEEEIARVKEKDNANDVKKHADDAKKHADDALKIADQCGHDVEATDAHLVLARLRLRYGLGSESVSDHVKKARELIEKTDHHRTKIELEGFEEALGDVDDV
ncbi:tetratricopeptide repeat protein [Candidatus Poribacteria bacterium]